MHKANNNEKIGNIEKILMQRDEMSLEEAKETVQECREAIAEGEDPEEILYDLGLEIDYIFDLLY